ncbi:osteocalcin isoform 2-T2 [Dama dama]
MRALVLLALLALATLCLAGRADAKPGDAESGKGAAFVSKQEGSEVVKRLRRYLDPGLGHTRGVNPSEGTGDEDSRGWFQDSPSSLL